MRDKGGGNGSRNCVCMQHNEANTIIYKTPVGDMEFHSLSDSASKSIFGNINPTAAAVSLFSCTNCTRRSLNEFAKLQTFVQLCLSLWKFSGEFLMD